MSDLIVAPVLLTEPLDPEVHIERSDFCRHPIVHKLAERERALADGTPTPRDIWQVAADGLIDIIGGIWQSPVTSSRS